MAEVAKKLTDYDSPELAEYFDYLDDLRESGVTNMFGAGTYLTEAFGLSRRESHVILKAWMDTFSDKPVDDRVFAALALPA